MKKKSNPLAELPPHIIKKNKKWFIDTKTGKWISISNIQNHLPKPKPTEEEILLKRWDLNY